MLKLFHTKHRSIIGIDISSTSVKILELSGHGDDFQVLCYASGELPKNSIENSVIKDIEAVGQCIKKLINDNPFQGRRVALAVPDAAVISKVVQINDGLNEAEMEELVILEADKFIPYAIDEINLDFEVVGTSAKNSAMLDVLVVASRAENISSRVDAVSNAGLKAIIMDVESYAVERVINVLRRGLPAEGKDKIIAIIDIGAIYSHLFVLDGMKMIFSREEEFGGKQLSDAIAVHYGMTVDEANAARKAGTLAEDYQEKVLNPFIETLLLQVKRTLQFFYSTGNHNTIDYILLAGGVANIPNLASLMQKRTGIETSIANPFAHMTIGPVVNQAQLYNDATTLMVACGLALRQGNVHGKN